MEISKGCNQLAAVSASRNLKVPYQLQIVLSDNLHETAREKMPITQLFQETELYALDHEALSAPAVNRDRKERQGTTVEGLAGALSLCAVGSPGPGRCMPRGYLFSWGAFILCRLFPHSLLLRIIS